MQPPLKKIRLTNDAKITFFGNRDLLIHLSNFLELQDLNNLKVNKGISKVIEASYTLSIFHLKCVIKEVSASSKRTNEINPESVMQNVITTNIFDEENTNYMLFCNSNFILFRKTFRDNHLLKVLETLLPFTTCPISNLFIEKYTQYDQMKSGHNNLIGKAKNKLQIAENFENYIWQKIKINFDDKTKSVSIKKMNDEDIVNDEIILNSKDMHQSIVCMLCIKFAFYKWKEWIDWTHFMIMGGCIFMNIIKPKITMNEYKGDIDIFALNLSRQEFNQQIKIFEDNLHKENVHYLKVSSKSGRAITFIMNLYIDIEQSFEFLNETFDLIDLEIFENSLKEAQLDGKDWFKKPKYIKIQFICSCTLVSIAQILSSFDFSAVQCGYDVEKKNNIFYNSL